MSGRKVTNADLFSAPPPQQRQPQRQMQPQAGPMPPPAQPGQQQRIQIPREGQCKMRVHPNMAPPGQPQQTMLPISPIPGAPPQALVPVVFTLPPHAKPGMEVEVAFQVIGPPQPVPAGPPGHRAYVRLRVTVWGLGKGFGCV